MTNTNKCSSLRSIIKCYFIGYSPYPKCDYNVARKKKNIKKNTNSKKEDVFYTVTSRNPLNIFNPLMPGGNKKVTHT